MTTKDIVDFCSSIGLDTVGFMKCRALEELRPFYQSRKQKGLENEFEEVDIEKRININHYMPEAKTVISIAFPYFHLSQQGISENETAYIDNGFSLYTRGKDYHSVVKSYLEKIKLFLEEQGYKSMTFVDSNTLPERYIAYMSGVGFIGKNGLIITKKYGSYVFLGEILTEFEDDYETNDFPGNYNKSLKEMTMHSECGDCTLCYSDCKTKAINKVIGCNPNICTSYITQKKQLDDKEIKLLKGKVFGCDDCQRICPYNQGIKTNVLEEFKPFEFMNRCIIDYANMDNTFFKQGVNKSSCGWRGKNVIKRNAIIRLANDGEDITTIKSDSPYISEYINRLTNK